MAQLATIEQQREIMRYMQGLNEWLDRDVQDRQEEIRQVTAGVNQLRDLVTQILMGPVDGTRLRLCCDRVLANFACARTRGYHCTCTRAVNSASTSSADLISSRTGTLSSRHPRSRNARTRNPTSRAGAASWFRARDSCTHACAWDSYTNADANAHANASSRISWPDSCHSDVP